MLFSTTAGLISFIVRDPLVVSPDTTIIDAIAQMDFARADRDAINAAEEDKGPDALASSHQQIRASCALVVINRRYAGIVTAQDIVRLCAQRYDLTRTAVGQVMAHDKGGMSGSAPMDLSSTMHLVQQRGTIPLPVLDDWGYPVGLVTCESLQPALTQKLQQQRQIETLLLESEQRYASLAAIAPVGIFRTDPIGHCTYVNDRYCQITGAASSDALEVGWQHCIHPDDRSTVMAAWEQYVQKNRPFSLECRLRQPDGTVVWGYCQAMVERDAEGRATGYVGALTDISAQKQTEADLRHSEATNRTIVDTIPDLLIQMNRHGYYSYMVGGTDVRVKWPANIGSEPDIRSILPPQEAERRLYYANQAIETNTGQVYEQLFDFDGDLRHEEVRIAPLNEQEVLVIIRDITERKQAEMQFQSLFEGTAAATGQDFFPALARHIAQALNVSHAGVTEKIGNELQVLAFWASGSFQSCGSFGATNLPCERTLKNGSFYFEGSIEQELVGVAGTSWGHLSAYLGIALRDSMGQSIGTLFIMNEQPIQDPQRASQILHIFAARAAAELERQRANTLLKELNQQLEAKVQERTAALQEREQFLQTVLDTFPLSIFWKDRDSVYLGCNRNFLQDANAASAAEVIGKTDYDMPWASSEADSYRADDQEVMASDVAKLEIVETQVQASGRQIWVETSKLPLHDLSDDVIGVLGTYQDITDRKQAEAQVHALLNRTQLLNHISSEIRDSLALQTIIQNSIDIIATELPADICTFAWCQRRSGSEDNGGQWVVAREQRNDELLSGLGTYRSDQFPHLFDHVVSNQIYQIDRLEQLHHDPRLADYLTRIGVSAFLCLPVHTASGKIGSLQIGRISTAQPWQTEEIELLQGITNQMAIAIYQAELYEESQAKTEQLQRSYRELEEAQRHMVQSEKMSSLGQIVAGVAHEINNPVGFIYGNIAVASDYANSLTALIKLYQQHYPNPPDAIVNLAQRVDTAYILNDFPKLLASVENGATRIQDIVQSLRTFSRLERAESSEVDIHSHIDSTLVLLQNSLNGRAGNPEIQVVRRYGGLPPVECYSGLLDQVFMNLLANAVDAVEEKREAAGTDYSGCITITTAIAIDSTVTISIKDNGKGMSPETQEKIFNPFFTTKPIGAGTGMGLSISYQVITASHKGELYCRSSLGHGTEFIIELAQRLPP